MSLFECRLSLFEIKVNMKSKDTASQVSDGDSVSIVIAELETLLLKGNAHASFDEAVTGISLELAAAVPAGLPYSVWQLVEHIRIAQWDILAFSRDPNHKSPSWPDEYWPKNPAPAGPADFKKSVEQVSSDRMAFISLLRKADKKIYNPLPYGEGQSLFREALLIADHTSYHTGEIILLRRLLGDWK
jgi:hypothetical protein